MSVRTEFVDFADEAPRVGGGARSYAELCKAMEATAPAPYPNQPTGAPVASFVPIETKRAPLKPAGCASTVSSIFDGMALNAAAPTAVKKPDSPKAPASAADAGPQRTIERPKPNPGAAAVDVKAEELLDQETVAKYESTAAIIDSKIMSIGFDQTKRKSEKKVTKTTLDKEYKAIGELREMADSWEPKLKNAPEQLERLEKQRAKIRELISANRTEVAELDAVAAAKAAKQARLEQKASDQGKTVDEVKKEEAEAAKAAKAEAAAAAKAARGEAKPARPKKKTPQEQLQEEYDAYVAEERAADAGAMAMTVEEFAARRKQQQKEEAAAKAQLTKAYNKYLSEQESDASPMTIEQYDAFLKQQKASEAAAAAAEATRRKNLTDEERAQEDAEAKAAAAAKGQLTKAYKKYVAERQAMDPSAEIMTVEQYEAYLKEQKRKEEDEARAEMMRRANLTEAERAEEDADNARMANAARAANAAAAKAYKAYVKNAADAVGQEAPDPKSKEWSGYVNMLVEAKVVKPEETYVAQFKDKKAREAHVELMQDTSKKAREGERLYKPPEFFQDLIDALTYSQTSEKRRMAAMSDAERAAIVDYANIVKSFEVSTAELLETLEDYKSSAEEAVKAQAEEDAKAKEAEALATAAKELAKAQNDKEEWVRKLRQPYMLAMSGMYELRWNLLTDMKAEARQYLQNLKDAPVVNTNDPNYDQSAVDALNRERMAVLDGDSWVQNMVGCLETVSAFECLKPDTTVDPITKRAYTSFEEEFNATKVKDAEYNDYAAKAGDDALAYEDYFDAKDGYEDYKNNLMSDASPMTFEQYLQTEFAEGGEGEEGEQADDSDDDGEEGEEGDEMADAGGAVDDDDDGKLDDSRGTLVQFSVSGLSEPYAPDRSLSEDAQRAAKTVANNKAMSKAKKFVAETLEPKLSSYMRGLSYLFAPNLAESQRSLHLDMANGTWFRVDPNATQEEMDEQVRDLARKTFPPNVSEDPNYIWLRNVPFRTEQEVDVLDKKTGLPTGATRTIGVGIFNDLDAFETTLKEDGVVDIRVPVEQLTEAEWPSGVGSPDLSRTPVPMAMRYLPKATNFGTNASSNLSLTERTVPISGKAEDDMRDRMVKDAIIQAITDDAISALLAEYLRTVSIKEWQEAIDPRVVGFEVEPELELTAEEREWLKSFAPAKLNQWSTTLRYNQKRSLLTRAEYEVARQADEEKHRQRADKGEAIDKANLARNKTLEETEEGRATLQQEREEEIKDMYKAYEKGETASGRQPLPFEVFKRSQLKSGK